MFSLASLPLIQMLHEAPSKLDFIFFRICQLSGSVKVLFYFFGMKFFQSMFYFHSAMGFGCGVIVFCPCLRGSESWCPKCWHVYCSLSAVCYSSVPTAGGAIEPIIHIHFYRMHLLYRRSWHGQADSIVKKAFVHLCSPPVHAFQIFQCF